MPHRKTRSEAAIAEQLQTLDPNSKRYKVLKATSDFKAAWVGLGQQLTVVREKQNYRSWGYADFYAYCRKELHIRQDTANKLTRSFAFLRDHEPAALRNKEGRELPPLDVVDLLSQAQDRSKVSEAQLKDISKEVFSPDGGAPTRQKVMNRIREVDPEAFRSAAPAKAQAGSAEVRKALLLSERLLSLLEEQPEVSKKTVDAVKRASQELRTLFEACQGEQEE